MSKISLFPCLITFLLISGCSTSNVTSMGNGVYMVSSSGAGFDTGGVRSNVYEAANDFCDKNSQSIKAVSYKDVKGKMASHPPSAELMFKCIKEADNAATTSLKDEQVDDINTNMTPVKKDVYTELIKLNELKEKGIISAKEFELEKAKILNN